MQGLIILLAYFGILIAATRFFTAKSRSKEEFYVGNRKFGAWKAALSIAATWVWAPSLFVSAERAYLTGFAGMFWFLVPNVLCLLIFIPFARKIRKELPEGVTLSEYMKIKYSDRVKNIYLVELMGLAVMSTVVQFVAGSKILSSVIGMPYWIITILIAACVFCYAQYSGIRASVTAEAMQIIMILGICFLLVAGNFKHNGLNVYLAGLGGISGNFKSIFSAGGKEVFLTFGLVTTIGLLSGPFGDQTFWQRAFSTDEKKLGKAFTLGAFIFALVPISISTLGFTAAGTGFTPKDTGLVNFEFIQTIFPEWVVWLFILMVISGLMSTVDSNLCAIPTLVNDIAKRYSLKGSKITMAVFILITALIANIPGMTVTTLFLFYGTLRASTLFTTTLTLQGVKLREAGVFYGVIASLVFGAPVFILGSLLNNTIVKIAGSLLAALLSGTIALIDSKRRIERA